jgi:dTDP-4-amino-4,6-dideoxygalactose transaminase
MKRIEFYKHNVSREDKQNVLKVLDSIFLTTGEVTYEVEKKLKDYLGIKHVVCVDSCTAALHLSLLALGIGPGDEVITTPMTFIATANSVLMAGARPVFVDCDPVTANINPDRIEKAVTGRTKAIMPVHLYGQMCDMKKIRKIARKHGLRVVEDSAHCIEGERDGIKPGEAGDCACFSFYATKNITCGEGGAMATRDAKLAEKVRRLSQHGMSKNAKDRYTKRYRHWDMVEMGWKYNLDNVRSSLLLSQIDKMDDFCAERNKIAEYYEKKLEGIPGLDFPRNAPGSKNARHLFTIWVDSKKRDELLAYLNEHNIGAAVNYRAIHLLSFYKKKYGYRTGMFPEAERIGKSTISIPLYPKLTKAEMKRVVDTIKAFYGK